MRFRVAIGVLGVLLLAAVVVQAQEGSRPYRVQLRLRAENDDNIFTRDDPKVESWKIIVQPEATVSYPTEQSYLGVNYRFSYIYYDNRPSDDTDLNHDLDVTASHAFSPRLSLSFQDVFRYGQEPEVTTESAVLQRNGDFGYNSANLAGIFSLNELTRLDGGFRYLYLRYDDEIVAASLDYDAYIVYLNANRVLRPTTTGVIGYRYEDYKYVTFTDRDRVSNILMAGVDQIFSPTVLSTLRVGWQAVNYDAEGVDDNDAPYADLSGTWMYSATGRLILGYRYSQESTDLGTFFSRGRQGVYTSLAQDLSPKLAMFLGASYDDDSYDAAESETESQDGSEEMVSVTARLAYAVREMFTLEAGYMYTDLSSDYGRGYDRNRYYLGARAVY